MAFSRLIATAPRECSSCEDEIPEGAVFTKIADRPVCLDCESYEMERGRDPRRYTK